MADVMDVIEMPMAAKVTEFRMNFKEVYTAHIMSRAENDKDIDAEMAKINAILAVDGFQMVKWEKRNDFVTRIVNANKNI